jgi:hypothetical protein
MKEPLPDDIPLEDDWHILRKSINIYGHFLTPVYLAFKIKKCRIVDLYGRYITDVGSEGSLVSFAKTFSVYLEIYPTYLDDEPPKDDWIQEALNLAYDNGILDTPETTQEYIVKELRKTTVPIDELQDARIQEYLDYLDEMDRLEQERQDSIYELEL